MPEEVDASIYKVPQAGPLDLFTKMVTVGGAIQQQRLQQQELALKQQEFNARQVGIVNEAIGSLPPNADRVQVTELMTRLARNHPEIPGHLITGAINAAVDDKTRNRQIQAARDWSLGPATLNQQVDLGPDEQGRPQKGPLQSALRRATTVVPVAPTDPSAPPGPAGATASAPGSAQPGSTAPIEPKLVPTTSYKMPGAIVTGLPPGSEKSAEAAQNDLLQAKDFQTQYVPVKQALDLVHKLGPGGIGPGSEGRQEFQSFLYALSPVLSKTLGIDPQKIKNYDELRKYLNQIVTSRANGFGSGSVEHLKATAGGNPSVHISDMATEDVLKMYAAMLRMDFVRATKFGGDPVNYTKHAAEWSQRQDPSAYMIDRMTPDQIMKLEKSLKGAERAKFNASLKDAIDAGVLDRETVLGLLKPKAK